jgi:chromosome segregation ATPase
LKTLYILLVILFCSTSLHAENASILTEIEMIQEKIWYLNRDMGRNKTSLEEQQKQLGLLADGTDKERLELNERFTALIQANTDQQEGARQMESSLEELGESLSGLVTEARQQNSAQQDQAGKMSALEESLRALQAELMKKQDDTGQALTDLRAQLAEARAQMVETRSQLDSLGQNMGGRVEQIGYWVAGAALILAITLTIGMALRKNKGTPRY